MSISALTSQLVPTMLEQVRPKMPYYLVQKESRFMKLFNTKAEKHNVSAFYDTGGAVLAWRVPVLTSVGGEYRAISLDGGDLGTGTLMNTAFMAFGTFENDIGFNIPLRTVYGTRDQKQAITNALQFTLGNAMKEMALYNEIGFFGDSTGTLATSTTTASGTGTTATYTLETAAFNYIRLRGKGAIVDVYSTAGLLVATGAAISAISFSGNTVTITGATSYTPANGDILAFPGMGLPVNTYTQAAGSWRNGLYTFNSTSTSGSLGGLAYSSVYELATPVVNANGGSYTPSVLYSGKSQLIQRRDDDAFMSIIGVSHPAQMVSWKLQGLTFSNWFRGKSDSMIDIAPKYDNYQDTQECGGVTHYMSRYANKSRVDWIAPANWGWTQLTDIDFIQTPEGQRIFIGRSSTTGNPQAGYQFYIVNTRQLYNVDPGCGVVFYGLAIPAGQ